MSESNMQNTHSPYTPTTEEVRSAAISDDWGSGLMPAEFDRWLAEIKAQAWEEGRYTQYREYPRPARRDNPYRQGEEQ